MAGIVQTDPNRFPRPYPMVVRLLEHATGIRMSPQRAAQLEKNALKKLAKALTRELLQ